jgi:hypothetical protein
MHARPNCRRTIDRGGQYRGGTRGRYSSGLGISGNLYSPLVARIEPVIVYDFEPGVIVRT